jgi:predicted alpha/beta superfamily hydrolase
MIRALGCALLALTVAPAIAQAAPSAHPPAEIWYTEQFVVHSKIVGRDFLIQVAKPFIAKVAKAPAIYVLDGNLDFGIAEGIMGPDGAVGSMQPSFVVGIGYPSQDKPKWLTQRNADLLFVPLKDEALSGHGATFERFIKEELRPYIEAHYAADPHKAILAGQSFGGLFAAHVLLNDPTAFDGYIVGSPSVWAEPGLLERAAAFDAPARVRVFIGVGAQEAQQYSDTYHMVSGTQALADRLWGHAANIDLTLWVVPEENHYTVTAPLFERAFRFVLPPLAPAK